MRLAVPISNFAQEFSENLFLNSDNPVTINTGGSNATITKDNSFTFSTLKSTKIDFINNASPIDFTINGVSITANRTGKHCLSIRFFKTSEFATIGFFTKVFVNGVLTANNTLEYDLGSTGGFVDNVWNCYAQTVDLNIGDVVTFSFETLTDDENCILYVDGFKFEATNYPTIFTLPNDQKTAWESKADTTNTIALTGATNNLFSLTATSESNGGLVFLNSVSKVQPLKLGDFLVCDLAFTAITPSGADNFITIYFIVNSVVYGAQTFNLLKGSGNDDEIRVSFGLPVSSDFLANGGEFYINPNVDLDIKNRYISVSRTHKGV
jgi:hypothetical protein